MSRKLSYVEIQQRVSQEGLKTLEGLFLPYTLLTPESEITRGRFSPADILCRKYGTFHVNKVSYIWEGKVGHPKGRQEKHDRTCLSRFGVTHQSKSPTVQTKMRETFQQKYGVENPLLLPEIRQKGEVTNLQKYGVRNVFELPKVQANIRQKMFERHGVRNVALIPEVQQKRQQNSLVKHGTLYPIASTQIQNKVKATNQRNHGADYPLQISSVHKQTLQNRSTNIESGVTKVRYGKAQRQLGALLLKMTGKHFTSNWSILGDREIDLYCEELKVGIEYCGVYWHNEDSKDPRAQGYHQDKFERCLSQGVLLITLFDDEWKTNKEEVRKYLECFFNQRHHLLSVHRRTKYRIIYNNQFPLPNLEKHLALSRISASSRLVGGKYRVWNCGYSTERVTS